MHVLSIDLETYSSVDIKKSGAWKYIQSPDFEVLLFSCSLDGAYPVCFDLKQGEQLPGWVVDAITNPEYIKTAFNASFEWGCLSKYLGRWLPPEQWRCTMVKGLYAGYPGSLDAVGRAIGLPEEKQKLNTGKALIRYFCVPCKPTKANGGRTRNLPHHDPDKWKLFKEYNIGDVVTEMEVGKQLYNIVVPDFVQKEWEIDLIINARGVTVDMDMVHGALEIGAIVKQNLTNEAKPKIKKAETHCGIALWKSMGYYDTNIQRGVEAQIKHNDTWKDKAIEWAMKGAENADKLTWGYLWNACELEVRETRPDLKAGSQEFYDAISKRLRDVVYSTQVVDSIMTRSQIMRSTDGRDKMLTAFASEPTLSYNMLQDAYMEYSLDARRMGKKEAVKKNIKRIARVVYAYTMTNAIAALVESAFDVFREDDDEEMDMIVFMKLYFKNFAFDMSIGNKIPYIKDLYSLLQGYSSSRLDTQWAQYLYSAINTKKPSKFIRDTIRTASQIFGLPFYSIYRDTMALLNKLDLFTEEDLNEMFEDFLD